MIFRRLFLRVFLRAMSLLGKRRALPLMQRLAALTRAWAATAHRGLFHVLWSIPPQTEYQDHFTDMYFLWQEQRQPFFVERGLHTALALPEEANVLELCCGDGFYTRYFYSRRARHITALDYDADVIEYARRYNGTENTDYQTADIRQGLPEGPFDIVIWNGAIEHFTPAEIEMIMDAVKARLRPGGILTGWTIAEVAEVGKQLSHHEYEFKDKEDLARFFTPHFDNVKVWEDIWPPRHTLFFWASDGILPFDSEWQQAVSLRKPKDITAVLG